MGLLDFFGGKKAPPPPKELREIGKWQFGRAKRLGELGDELEEGARSYAPQLRGLYEQSAADIAAALMSFKAHGNRALEDLETLYGPTERKALEEVLHAGGEDRQNYEARRARDAALSQGADALRNYQNSAMARGADATHTGEMSQAYIGQAYAMGNQARHDERMRGEAIRMQLLPQLGGLYNQAVDRAVGVPTRLAEAQGRALTGASDALGALISPALNLYQTSSVLGSDARDSFAADYDARMQQHQANAARKAKIFSGITQVAGAAITGGMSGGWAGAAGGLAEGLTGGAISGSSVADWIRGSSAGQGGNPYIGNLRRGSFEGGSSSLVDPQFGRRQAQLNWERQLFQRGGLF